MERRNKSSIREQMLCNLKLLPMLIGLYHPDITIITITVSISNKCISPVFIHYDPVTLVIFIRLTKCFYPFSFPILIKFQKQGIMNISSDVFSYIARNNKTSISNFLRMHQPHVFAGIIGLFFQQIAMLIDLHEQSFMESFFRSL